MEAAFEDMEVEPADLLDMNLQQVRNDRWRTDGGIGVMYTLTFQESQFDEVLETIDISIQDNPITSPTDHILLYQAPFYFYPVFEIVHYLITAAKIRSDYGQEFARSVQPSHCCYVECDL